METKQYDWIILSSNLTLRLLWPKTPQPRRGGIARRKELKSMLIYKKSGAPPGPDFYLAALRASFKPFKPA